MTVRGAANRESQRRARPSWAGTLLFSLALFGMSAAASGAVGKQAWTHARVSAGLHSLEQAARVAYQPAPGSIPPAVVITQVLAQRDYAGQADVHTSLCWNGIERCVDIVGGRIDTQAFDGLDASRPFYLVHRVTAWRGSRPPLYVKGNVTVWYAPTAGKGSARRP